MTGNVTGVGVGPGDPELLTLKAARLVAAADVLAFHSAPHGRSIARAVVEAHVRPGQVEELLVYPVTTGSSDDYAGALEAFYDEAAARLAVHVEAGRSVVVLCEGDPAFYGSYQHLHARLAHLGSTMVPGVSSLSAAAAAVGRALVQHEETLTVVPGTLPAAELTARLRSTDAAVVFKLGRTLSTVQASLAQAGRLDDAWVVERASSAAERVSRLGSVTEVPYMSIAVVPGAGVRAHRSARPVVPGVVVVGLGPGDEAWTTPETAAALASATDLVGYTPYVDRVPVRPGQRRHPSGNQVEGARARLALDLARGGARVAVVSSGDPGVFAMATAVLDEAQAYPDVDVTVLPGVTAAQAVAARVGAPLGHDFCVLSLSDRLKPFEVVLERVEAAARADLVMALYNPTSASRTWQLPAVVDLLRQHRKGSTAVVVARAVGRADERVDVVTLDDLDPAVVDMSTLLVVGSSETRVAVRDGRPVVWTPRVYGPGGTSTPG